MILLTGGMRGSSYLSRVMVFIDGGYFEKRIHDKRISDKLEDGIKYGNLAQFLTAQTARGSIRPQLMRSYYYDAVPSLKDLEYIQDENEKKKAKAKIRDRISKQESKLDKISMLDMFDVRKGRLVYADGEFRQKGVDSLIAIDMLSKAHNHQYDEAVLVAGDSDFIEVVKAVKETGVRVAGAYFNSGIQKELVHSFDKHIIFDNYDLVHNNLLE